MKEFKKVHSCGHLYGSGGKGERMLDLAPFMQGSEQIIKTIDLPGFIDQSRRDFKVTYESHHFYVHFVGRGDHAVGLLVVVHHGAGWEVWRGDRMLADAIAAYGNDQQGLFKLCWFMIEATRSAAQRAAVEESTRYKTAFVHGALKKRKQHGTDHYKVWIDESKVA